MIEYQRKTWTTEHELELMEDMNTWDMRDPCVEHKERLGDDIAKEFDAICIVVRGFVARNESAKYKTKRLEAQARTLAAQEKETAAEAAAEAIRQAQLEARLALQRRTALENARDLEAKGAWKAARLKVTQDVRTVNKTYEGLASRLGDGVSNFVTAWNSPGYLHVGQILGGLIELSEYMATKTFKRTEDTYQCCQLLRDCTVYLACDDKYKRKGRLSKDDRFTGIYRGGYTFRRTWVAFLSQIAGYVEMLWEDEEADNRLYLNRDKLASMHHGVGDSFWLGRQGYPAFEWSVIKRDIATAQAAIDQEPEPERSWLGWGGSKRVQAKLHALKELVDADESPEASEAGDHGR